MKARRAALRHGRDAALARLRGETAPVNPHRHGTKGHLYWQWGFEQADRLIARVLEIGG